LRTSLAILALALAAGTGCGGINASGSVSPASFFLPGFFGKAPVSKPAPGSMAKPIPAVPTDAE
jgi:hypothetical protein